MNKLNVLLITDNLCISHWQNECIKNVIDLVEIKGILNCQNTKNKKRFFSNFLYYILNFVSLKNQVTKPIKISNNILSSAKVFNFYAIYKGIWQHLPSDINEIIIKQKPDIIIKFGMSLLSISNDINEIPIFSFHHGDPQKYRGRPAGFYEMLANEKSVGMIVQKLSNKLDAGLIYAKGFSKLHPFSYKLTMKGAYTNSVPLFRKAIQNFIEGISFPNAALGRNYTLPSNKTVLEFFLKLLVQKINRIIYGLFFEKKWNASIQPSTDLFHDSNLRGDHVINLNKVKILQIPRKYHFIADPFLDESLTIRVEALNRLTGRGEILERAIHDKEFKKLPLIGTHFSYPGSFQFNNKSYLLPEMEQSGQQKIFEIPDMKSIDLNGFQKFRITDPTYYFLDGVHFIFFTDMLSNNEVLYLYTSKDLRTFHPHKRSPLLVDPKGSRMAGNLFKSADDLYRFGQNNDEDYGSSISIFKVDAISDFDYVESKIGNISVQNVNGPHTINIVNGNLIFDFYSTKFSIYASIRRLLPRIIQFIRIK